MLSVAVQAHPSRADLAEQLAAEVDGEVVYDPDPASGLRSPWRTYRRALEQTPPHATHQLVLQDDVIVCDRFRAAAEAATMAKPDRPVSFFVGGNARRHAEAVRRAAAAGRPWLELTGLTWCPVVALSWPVELIEPLFEFVDSKDWPAAFRADDEIVGRFFGHARVTPLATVPSLVDHPDDVPSLLGRGRARNGLDRGRIAACWVGNCDVTTIDWTADST